MLRLYEDPGFTFRFAEDRIIPRFHLEDVEPGRRVSIHMIERITGKRPDLLATVVVGSGGWVDLPEPIVVRAGDVLLAIPK